MRGRARRWIFALGVVRPAGEVDLGRWHFRERKTVGAAAGRTYGEGRLWDEEGRLVAVETQACILRPLGGRGVAKI